MLYQITNAHRPALLQQWKLDVKAFAKNSSWYTLLNPSLNPCLALLLQLRPLKIPLNPRLKLLVAAESSVTASERKHNVETAPLEDQPRELRFSIVANEHQSLSIVEPAWYAHA